MTEIWRIRIPTHCLSSSEEPHRPLMPTKGMEEGRKEGKKEGCVVRKDER